MSDEVRIAWECQRCGGIDVQDDKPLTMPPNRLARCYETGHDWKRIAVKVVKVDQ